MPVDNKSDKHAGKHSRTRERGNSLYFKDGPIGFGLLDDWIVACGGKWRRSAFNRLISSFNIRQRCLEEGRRLLVLRVRPKIRDGGTCLRNCLIGAGRKGST